MTREQLDTWCERGILALTLAALAFAALATGAVRPFEFAIVQWLTAGAALLWVARLWLNDRPQLLWPPICWAVLAFAGYAIARYLKADIEYVARQELIRVLVYALFFLTAINNLYRQDSIQVISWGLVFLGMGIAIYATYQFLSGSDRVWTFISPYPGRAGGTFICPNHLAGFLEMTTPLALAFAIVGRVKPVWRVLFGYAAGVMLCGIVVSMSRGGWIAMSIALVVFVGILVRRRNFRLIGAAVLVLLIAGLGYVFSQSFYLQQRFKRAFLEDKPTKVEDIRFELWQPAVQIWRDHVWFGAGPGHFDRVFPAYRTQTIQLRPDRVHNDYLNTLADWGVVGALLVTGAFVLLALGVRKTWNSVRGGPRDLGSNQSNKFAVLLGASVGLVAILLHSAVDFNMHVPANALVMVTLLALVSVHLRFATESYWLTARLWLKGLATLVLLGGIAYLGAQGWQRVEENHWLTCAQQAPALSEAELIALQRAYACDLQNADTIQVIGEHFRKLSWEGGFDYAQQAEEALKWYARGMKLNPHDADLPLHYAMCLDWLDRQLEAEPFIERALSLDPNNYFILANVGWHFVQTGDLPAAEAYLLRSWRLEYQNNQIAQTLLPIVRQRMAEAAAR